MGLILIKIISYFFIEILCGASFVYAMQDIQKIKIIDQVVYEQLRTSYHDEKLTAAQKKENNKNLCAMHVGHFYIAMEKAESDMHDNYLKFLNMAQDNAIKQARQFSCKASLTIKEVEDLNSAIANVKYYRKLIAGIKNN